MNTLKLKSTDTKTNGQVSVLQTQLNAYKLSTILKVDGDFGAKTEAVVKLFQEKYGLTPDGVVGFKTWSKLLFGLFDLKATLTKKHYTAAANLLDCDVASIKAVKEVETGGLSAFDYLGRPRILFEGHIFYSELKKAGFDVDNLYKVYPTVVYPKWDKSKYTNNEWNRIAIARRINIELANKSASWGLFQIMGNNFKKCNCSSIENFIERNERSEVEQLHLFVDFIYNCKYDIYLRNHEWAKFAKAYNGSGYAKNKYDTKLATAYKKYNK